MKKRDARKEESESKILGILKEKGYQTFSVLLAETGLARSTLSQRLKNLMETGKIERYYNTYKITEKGIPEIYIESMIQNLGIVATHYIVRKKLNLPIEHPYDIREEIKEYLKQEPKTVTWKQLFDYLQEKYPLVI